MSRRNDEAHLPNPPDRAGRAWRRLRTGILALAATLVIGVTGVVAYAAELYLTGNFHTVVEHEAYRAGQPSASELESYVQRVGIRTVINLRGENTGSPWYDEEVGAARRLGLAHIDFRMSSRRQLSQAEAAKLIVLMRDAEKPILIHCAGGADRSGLAAALYVAAIARGGDDASEAQLSLAYGHIPYSGNPAYAMDRTFEALETWLGVDDDDDDDDDQDAQGEAIT